MRVLAVNKFYYRRGGSETCFFALKDMYAARNMEMIPFSVADDRNEPSRYAGYFVRPVDYEDKRMSKKISYFAKTVYSLEASRKVSALIRDSGPDIAHLHVFQHQLSPSIIHAIKRRGIPVVYTAHDLKPLCPCYTMLRGEKVCELCKGGRYYHCLQYRCLKGSAAASLAVTLEMYLHDRLSSYRLIDAIITPSSSFRDKFIEYGYSPDKVHHIRNFIDCSAYRAGEEAGDYFIYCGRLSAEKGIFTLLGAMKYVKRSKLLLAGSGPIKKEVEEFIHKEKLDNVHLTGHLSGRALTDLIEGCRFAVLPSKWYENCPMSALEAMACGKPVIGAAIGGIPEMIEHGSTGLLFAPDDCDQLARLINRLLDEPGQCRQMGRRARAFVEREYDPERNFSEITYLYDCLLRGRGYNDGSDNRSDVSVQRALPHVQHLEIPDFRG
ncbi:MAG: glycosyltransferase family 4 protein [Clostridiales bacterium]|nr:glycosyltransferase family 4 protein [Clostridiales bacterium]